MFSLRKRENAGKKEDKLGVALYQQQKYQEAEEAFRQAVQGREKMLGKEHKATLNSIHLLGLTLHQQREHQEAEEVLRQAVQGREKVLGKEHEDTLDSKYSLGLTLYEQQKHHEAEGVLRQAVQGVLHDLLQSRIYTLMESRSRQERND